MSRVIKVTYVVEPVGYRSGATQHATIETAFEAARRHLEALLDVRIRVRNEISQDPAK